jgi:hypothetical protein
MLTDLRLKVEKAAAKPGFDERRLRKELIPLLTEYGELGLTPSLFKPKTTLNRPGVGVSAVASSDASKAPRKQFVSQQQQGQAGETGGT